MSQFTTSKVDGNTVSAAEWNQLAGVNNAITTSGQTPSTGDLNQLSKAMANYAAVSTFYTDSGVADAYVLTPIATFKAPSAYIDGMEIRFRAGNAGTGGAATVNVSGLGIKSLKEADGATDPASVPITEDSVFRYDGIVFRKVNFNVQATESLAGIAEIATATEAKAFTDDQRIITPLKLSNAIGQIAIFEDQKASGTNGGTFTAGAWQTRTLNTTVSNGITGASLASNQVELLAGTYEYVATVCANDVDKHRIKLYNITAAADVPNSFSINADTTNSSSVSTNAISNGTFTLGVTSKIEIRHRCSLTQATYGFGNACSFGDPETFARLELKKIA